MWELIEFIVESAYCPNSQQLVGRFRQWNWRGMVVDLVLRRGKLVRALETDFRTVCPFLLNICPASTAREEVEAIA